MTPQSFRFTREDERETLTFELRPPAGLRTGTVEIRAVARDAAGHRFDVGRGDGGLPAHPSALVRAPFGRRVLRVAPLALTPAHPARLRPRRGRPVPEALRGVGLPVTVLDAATLEGGDLGRFDAIVIGPRAYETDSTLVEANARLLDYARRGGLVLVQYQQQGFFDGGFAPYRLTVGGPSTTPGLPPVSHDRVTEETAPIRILAPGDSAMRVPNQLTAADWQGWVQERGLYFARSWDPAYRPLLETHDPGEGPLEGGLLVARVGRGTYVYTGLSFFRQLPAGVPGAFRLFANLLALGVEGRRRVRRPSLALSVLPLARSSSCCSDPRTPVVVYSPHGRDQLTLLEHDFERTHPNIDIRWLDMGSQEILDRLRFERVNPQADVWFGGPTTIFDRGVQDSLLAPYRPAWHEGVGPRGIGAGDLYYPAYRTPAVIAYNSRVVSRGARRRRTGTRARAALVRQGADPGSDGERHHAGHLGAHHRAELCAPRATPTRGMTWLRRLDGQTKAYALNPAILDARLARAEGLVTLWDLPDILISRSKGMPFGYVFPRSGTVVIDDAIGLVRGGRHPAAARDSSTTSAACEAQLLAADKVYRLPARHDLPPDRLPPWVAEVEREMIVADVDWDLLARQGPAWMGYWDRHVRGTGRRRSAPVTAFLRLEQLVKRFDGTVAVNGLSLALERGEIMALLGPSGSGKTTTLRLLAGLRDARQRPRAGGGRGRHRRRAREPPLRHGVPALRALPASRCPRRTSRSGWSRSASTGPSWTGGSRGRWRWWISPASSRAASPSSPAASSSGSRWRARSRPSRACSCSTSRCRNLDPDAPGAHPARAARADPAGSASRRCS